MNASLGKPRGMGITLRTALWSWGVALTTLLIFAGVIIPQQKRMFQENLESKAHGVAVSLRDVTAGAVVNEDFSSVVDHCKEMLNGDSTLDYLVITKNDGFSLINERSGWRSEPQASLDWRPEARAVRSGIGTVPLFNRRVFYYSQPFDYSGIQWGWIHVGLSLQSYDRNVASVYQRTSVLAVACILLSLGASAFYARRLVRPILSLHNVVRRVAGGDLGARADVERRDELGTLSASINAMTEALLRRDRILESVRFAAQQFLGTADWNGAIQAVLAKIGQAADVSRAYVFENKPDPHDGLQAIQTHEWVPPGSLPPLEGGPSQAHPYEHHGLDRWSQALGTGHILSGLVAEMPAGEQALFSAQGILSLIAIPIHVDGLWWGFLRFDDCTAERLWTHGERDSLRAAADMLGATIARQRVQQALVEAKETLEHRVLERTHQLEEQVLARDRANMQLAEAQQKLMSTSRQAGMAEVATGVLHNVGNVLNSVNVSVNLISDQLSRSQTATLSRVTSLLQGHRHDLAAFLSSDPKGCRVPELLPHLAATLEEERTHLAREVQSLQKNVEHIKEIVSMQQSYAKVAGVIEDLPVADLLEDALRMNQGAFQRHGVVVKRSFEPVPLVRVDKHKVLQILINLLRNAKYAMEASTLGQRVLSLTIQPAGQRVKVLVQDNGMGIAPENLTRIFGHGFTTKKDGHGFGLHSGALAAKEMGGSLQAFSDGPNTGATFLLQLPVATPHELGTNREGHGQSI